MEGKELDKVTAFDTLFTTNHIQMCKVLLSCLPPSYQKLLAVYIKFSELVYTLSFFQNHPGAHLAGFPASGSSYTGEAFSSESVDFPHICDELMPWLTPAERDRVGQMKNMMQSMKNMQDMMEMMQMMKELFPEDENSGGNGDLRMEGSFNGSKGDGSFNGSGNDSGSGTFDGNGVDSGSGTFDENAGSTRTGGLNMNMLSALAGMTGMDVDPAMLSQVMQMFSDNGPKQ